jgi:adenylate cyclase
MAVKERRPAAVLYAELRNFTRLSEVLQPDKVMELVNEFFSLAAHSIKENTGKVLSVHNDGLVAAFAAGAPAEFNGQAVKTAQAIQGAFGAVGERWQKEYGLRPVCRRACGKRAGLAGCRQQFVGS